mgnify:CR=1 FL=1
MFFFYLTSVEIFLESQNYDRPNFEEKDFIQEEDSDTRRLTLNLEQDFQYTISLIPWFFFFVVFLSLVFWKTKNH